MRRKALSNRLLVPSCCSVGIVLARLATIAPFDFEYPVSRHMGGAVAPQWLDQRLDCSITKVEATPPPQILLPPGGLRWGPITLTDSGPDKRLLY
jgi:hypothetical protein